MHVRRQLDAFDPPKWKFCGHQENAPLARTQIDKHEAAKVHRQRANHAFEYGGWCRQIFVGVAGVLARQSELLRPVNTIGFDGARTIKTGVDDMPMQPRLHSVRDPRTET